jgi:hypothetical protein
VDEPSGEGRAKLHRRDFGERVENVAGSGEYHWMAGNFVKYAGPLTAKNLGTTAFPAIETVLIDGDIAFRQHKGGHTAGPNWPTFPKFAERTIKAPAAKAPPGSEDDVQGAGRAGGDHLHPSAAGYRVMAEAVDLTLFADAVP